jgi:S1-C subfamily serine protease
MLRRLSLIHALAGLALAVPLAPGALAQDRVVPSSTEALRMSYAPIVKRVTPAVVTVSAAKTVANRNPLMEDPFFRRFFGPQFGGPRDQVQRSARA